MTELTTPDIKCPKCKNEILQHQVTTKGNKVVGTNLFCNKCDYEKDI